VNRTAVVSTSNFLRQRRRLCNWWHLSCLSVCLPDTKSLQPMEWANC